MIIKKGFLGVVLLFLVAFSLIPVLSVSPEDANKILLVDDDLNYPYEPYYHEALNSLNISYDNWSVFDSGSPSELLLNKHNIVIWFTGEDSSSTLKNTDQSTLQTFLNYGGCLFISSKFLGKDIGASSFYSDFLKVNNYNEYSSDKKIYGITNDPISDSINQFSLLEGYGANNSAVTEVINPINPAQTMLKYSNPSYPAGIRYNGNYSLIYLAFPFESISTALDREILMNKSMNYLLNNNNQEVYHSDSDGDHYGDSSTWIWANKKPAGYVLDSNDCNDSNANVRPGAKEICNGIDDNCNYLIDEEGAEGCTNYYLDADGDGYGTPEPKCLCNATGNYTSLNDGDCDDTDSNVHPGVPDICNGKDDDCNALTADGSAETPNLNTKQLGVCAGYNQSCINGKWRDYYGNIPNYEYPETSCDGLDNDCDGSADEGLVITFYNDSDGDGYGNLGSQFTNCSAPANFVTNYLDCDDSNPGIHPGAEELCNGIDDDCDKSTPDGTDVEILNSNQEGVCEDSYKSCLNGQMMDDYSSILLFQNNETLCDGLDNDCDGSADEGLKTVFYEDHDRDNFGDFSKPKEFCSNLPHYGYVLDHSDCNDSDNNTHPGALDLCNGNTYDDCDASTPDGSDEPVQNNTLQLGVCKGYNRTCSNGVMIDNYTNVSYYEAGNETSCDGLDNDCDGSTDEDLKKWFYLDLDHDTYGNPDNSTFNCTAPPDYVNNSLDCNDSNNQTHPGALDLCNGNTYDDCNASTPDGADEPAQNNTLQLGVCKGYNRTCVNGVMTDNYTPVPHYETGNETTCDGLDNNCNGETDENLTITYYADFDNDTYGYLNNFVRICPQFSRPENYVNNSLDCDDSNASINPNVTETCNYIDDNCNGKVDENLSVIYYYDADGDYYGNLTNPINICLSNPLPNTVNNSKDCDDSNVNINPNATETFNGYDDNCNSFIDEGIIGGNLTTITSNIPNLNITIGDSTNLTEKYSGIKVVKIFNTNRSVTVFSINFSEYPLNISNLILKSDNSSDHNGYTIIKNLDLHNSTKTVYVHKISNYNKVCIKDSVVSSVSEFSGLCNASGEILLTCPGNNGNYSCENSDNYYVVSGLKHSGVKEYGYCGDSIIQGSESCDGTNLNHKNCSDILGYSSGTLSCKSNCKFNLTQCVPIVYHSNHHRGGGGGYTLTGFTALPSCKENWTCTTWSVCNPNSIKTRTCTDSCTNKTKNESLACFYDTCHDGKLDGSEADIDCGGSCTPCRDGKHCRNDADCLNQCEPNRKYCYTQVKIPPKPENKTPINESPAIIPGPPPKANSMWIFIGIFVFIGIILTSFLFLHHKGHSAIAKAPQNPSIPRPRGQGIPKPSFNSLPRPKSPEKGLNDIELLIEKTKNLLDKGKVVQANNEYQKLHALYEKAPIWEKQNYKEKILDLNIASLEKGYKAK